MTDTNQLREAFEARMTDDGKWPAAVEKGRGGAYLLAQTENAWTEWEACAEAMQDRAQAHGEPVAWVVMNGLSKYQVCGAKAPADALCSEMQKRHDLSGSLAAFHVQPLYTHPAPGVPDDVVKDAERYRWLRENGTLGFSGAPSWRASVSFDAVDAYAQTLDSNIDAARAQKGQQ